MPKSRTTALLNYLMSTLSDRSFTTWKGVYYWTDDALEIAPDLRRLDSGWLVMLETEPYAVYINFAENVSTIMQERLKTLIGHCVVERIACHSPWLISSPELSLDVCKQTHSLLQ